MSSDIYSQIRSGRAGFYEQPRGLISVRGKEAVPFLDGMITNDMKAIENGGQMLAAFPNAQGRLLAVIRVLRQDDKFFIETEETTREKLYQNLYRFSFAGDFFVEDLSDGYRYFEIFGPKQDVYNPAVGERFPGTHVYELPHGARYCVPTGSADDFRHFLTEENGSRAISNELYETLRIESGIPKYGVDMDESTIVPELGLEGLISYNKGCYIGQEIIARIHFRGHVAKKLTGLTMEAEARPVGSVPAATELVKDGKNAGRVMSATYSASLDKNIALGFVRYDFLETGTILTAGDVRCSVTSLPFLNNDQAESFGENVCSDDAS